MTLVLALAAFVQDQPRNDPWAGFPAGSWIVRSTKTSAPDGRTTETREKEVILPSDASGVRRERMAEENGRFVPTKGWRMHAPGVFGEEQLTVKGSRRETLKAGGEDLACAVTDYEGGVEDGPRVRLSLWRSEGVQVPYRELAKDGADLALRPNVVKVELSIEREMSRESHVLQVVSLRERLKVGDRQVDCVLEEWTVRDVRGGEPREGKARRWLSDAVPGRVARLEGSLATAQGVRRHVEQVEDFHVETGK